MCTRSPRGRQETHCTTIQFHLQIYRGNVLSLKSSKFAEYFEFIYPRELDKKETMENVT